MTFRRPMNKPAAAKFFLRPISNGFLLENETCVATGEFSTIIDAIDALQTAPDSRGSVVVVFNSHGRAELQVNL